MKNSSFRLAASVAVTFFLVGSASAAGMGPRHGFIIGSHAHFGRHSDHFDHFGGRDEHGEHDFHHRRDREPALFAGGYYQDEPDVASAPDAEPGFVGPGGPTINITIAPPTIHNAGLHAPAYADLAAPKIIFVGPQSRAAHAQKLPTVVYGAPPT
jgi:hypothetical protein